MPQPVAVAEDRSLRVPLGSTVRTGCVSVWDVRLACRERLASGDVERACSRLLNSGACHPWPCPVGEWEEVDGRHEYVAHLMLGRDVILVAWVEDAAQCA